MRVSVNHLAAIIIMALLLTAPAVLSQPMTHDSYWINWVWADQFTRELSAGNLYPRWLPQSHGGLGSPVFYYYPPLAFHLTGLFGLMGFPTYVSIVAAFFTGFVASGFAMYAWLSEGAKSPLFGALLFMAAPYHVLDFYGRGAIAEFLAIAFIPLVALGLRRAVKSRFVLCAIAYAALILSHLPLALLVSLFFVIPYGLYLCRQEPRLAFRIAFPLLLGLATASIYLVPAIALDPFRDSALLWKLDGFKPENWTLLRWNGAVPPTELKLLVGIVILLLLQPTIVLLFGEQRRWGLYSALCLLMAGALIPFVWQLPLLKAVQFPYRMLPLAEFAMATGIARLTLPRMLIFAATLPAFALAAFFLLGERLHTAPDASQEMVAQYGDVPENLPPGSDRPASWPSAWALEVARSHPTPVQVGNKTIENVFYFPAWEVRCQGRQVPTTAEPGTSLLTYEGSGCERRLSLTTPERIGAGISLAGLLVILASAGFRKRSVTASERG